MELMTGTSAALFEYSLKWLRHKGWEIVSLETLLGGDAPRVKRRVKRRKAAKVAKAAAAEAPAPHKTAAAWSPAARRAVSLRMKKYWAARRQAKKR